MSFLYYIKTYNGWCRVDYATYSAYNGEKKIVK